MVYNGYYKVMSNIPKMGQLPTPVENYGKLVQSSCGWDTQFIVNLLFFKINNDDNNSNNNNIF